LHEQDWNELRPLLQDEDKEIAVTTAGIAVDWARAEEKKEAARFLIRSLDGAQWFLQLRIEECLRRNYPAVQEEIARESMLRRQMVKGEPLADPALRILEKIQSIGENCERSGKHRHAQ
jgi:hypothetical protein